jgi:hypothetical protein
LKTGGALAKGPKYFRAGRSIRYRVRDLDAWLDTITKGP